MNAQDPKGEEPLASDEFRPALKPPQFRLATLFLVIALACAILAAIATMSLPLLFVAAIFVLAVVLHVAGARIGGLLRENGSEKPTGEPFARRELQKEDFAPATGLSRRDGFPLTTIISTVCGSLLFGSIGSAVLCYLNWEDLTWLIAIASAIGPGVLGGIVGFASSGFVVVLIGVGIETHRK